MDPAADPADPPADTPSDAGPVDLATTPVHLGLGATVQVLPPFDGTMEWYERYSGSVAGDGAEGRLVSWHTFDGPWDSWEMHPHGDELVVCVDGTPTLHQDLPDGTSRSVMLAPGEAAVNAPGVWHTMDVDGPTTVLFVTAGLGTEHRPR